MYSNYKKEECFKKVKNGLDPNALKQQPPNTKIIMADLNRLNIIEHNVLNWSVVRRNELYNTYHETDPEIILTPMGERMILKIKSSDTQCIRRILQKNMIKHISITIISNINSLKDSRTAHWQSKYIPREVQ